MRVLYFSPRDCWPLTSGARLRDYYLARGISQCAHLTYLGFGTNSGDKIWRGRVGLNQELNCILVPPPPRYSPMDLVKGMIGPLPVTVRNFSSPAMRAELDRILQAESFDFVQIEGVHLSTYLSVIAAAPGPPRVIADWHNIESELIHRYAGNLSALAPKRWYAKRTARLVERLESKLLENCHAHLVCSERERQALLPRAAAATIRVIENGVDTSTFAPEGHLPGNVRRNLVFVGSMDYHANIDAVLYFGREVWPQLRQLRPDLRFVVVGSRPVPEVLALANTPGVEVTGTVEKIAPYYHTALAAVVPLRVGSGTRLKVLEAMAAGVPVISTPLGAEGLAVTHDRDLVLAASPAEFVSATLRISGDAREWTRIALSGRQTAQRYDWSRIGASLCEHYCEWSRKARR